LASDDLLEVDGSVISATELVQRVEELLHSADSRRLAPDDVVGEGDASVPAPPGLEQRVPTMRELQAWVQSPDVGQPVGIRGRGLRFVKRVVRRLAAWYSLITDRHHHSIPG
jgi:hypothetical protein